MSDIIAAYSGGALPAAIGIVRLSGQGASSLLAQLFLPQGGKPTTQWINKKLYYGKLIDQTGEGIDFCMACLHRAPRSFTGEEMAEIFCHGSAAVVNACLEHAFALGARPAEAGEFTKRAFLNGRMDLMDAEATADLIFSASLRAAKNAVLQLEGAVSGEIRALRAQILSLNAHFYAVCDYPEEEIDPFLYAQAGEELDRMAGRLEKLHRSYLQGALLKEGVPVAVVGKPNAGKSTLFNALLGFERAIVTDEAGTTRDIIEQQINIKGTAIRLLDTAGLREAESRAEQLGVERARQAADQAAAVLYIFDGSSPLDREDEAVLEAAAADKPCAAVINKTDLPLVVEQDRVRARFPACFVVSAKTGEGLEPVADWLRELLPEEGEALVTSARQAELMRLSAVDLRAAAQSALAGMTADAFLSDAERALHRLGEIIGEEGGADIAREIFSRFCVGK